MAHRRIPVARKKPVKSITIKKPSGRWVNIPLVVRGADVLPQFAKQLFGQGLLRPLGRKSFSTRAAAVKAAGRHPSGRTVSL